MAFGNDDAGRIVRYFSHDRGRRVARMVLFAVLLAFVCLPLSAVRAEVPDRGRLPALAEAARTQADRCWRTYRLPPGSDKVRPFRVIAVLDEAGGVRSSMLVDVDARTGSTSSQRLVDNALASLNACRFALPRDLYDLWKTMTFTYDPDAS